MIDNLAKIALEKGGILTPLKIPSKETKGTGLCNPSLYLDKDGTLLCNIRHVGYILYHSENKQQFQGRWGPLAYLHPEDDKHLRTTNYLCTLNKKTLEVETYRKVDTSLLDQEPVWEFTGLEDARVVRWSDKLYLTGVRRDTKPNGEGRMELSEVLTDQKNVKEVSRHRIQPPGDVESYCEKNWMPINDMEHCYVRWTNPTEIVKVNPQTKTSETIISKPYQELGLTKELRGGSSIVNWGKYRLGIIHEVDFWMNENNNKDSIYNHRIIVWDDNWNIVKKSNVFKFMTGRIEFVCGAAVVDNDLIVTFGFYDNAAYALRIPHTVVEELINE
jgi:hypothetical protein